jgi:hypothetical protein
MTIALLSALGMPIEILLRRRLSMPPRHQEK